MSAGNIEAQFRHEAAVRGDLRRINWRSSVVARQTNESNGPGMLNVSRAAVTLLSGLTGLGTRNTRSGTESLSPEVHAYAINTKDTEYEYRLASGRDFGGKPCTNDAGKPT